MSVFISTVQRIRKFYAQIPKNLEPLSAMTIVTLSSNRLSGQRSETTIMVISSLVSALLRHPWLCYAAADRAAPLYQAPDRRLAKRRASTCPKTIGLSSSRLSAWQTELFCLVHFLYRPVAGGALLKTSGAQDARSRFQHERSKCLGWHLRSGTAGNWTMQEHMSQNSSAYRIVSSANQNA